MSKILKYKLISFFLLTVFMGGVQLHAQETEQELDQSDGIERLNVLIDQAKENLDISAGTALGFAETALEYAEELKEDELTFNQSREINRKEADAHFVAGLAYEHLGNEKEAISNFRKARRIAQRTEYDEMTKLSLGKLKDYGKGAGFEVKVAKGAKNILSKAKEWVIKDTASNSQLKKVVKVTLVSSNEAKAEKAADQKDYARAIELYQKNIPIHKTYGDSASLKSTYTRIAELYKKAGNDTESDNYYLLADGKEATIQDEIPESEKIEDAFSELIEEFSEVFNEEPSPEEKAASNYLNMAEKAAREGKYEESSDYYKLFVKSQSQLKEAQERTLATRSLLDSQLIKMQLLVVESELKEREMREAELKTQRNGFIALGLLVAAILLGVLFFFNRRSHTKLTQTYKQLTNTHSQLKETQTQLVSAEKMASLGQLTAGIAHEINNPVNFISGNIDPLKNDVADLLQILAAYEEAAKSDQVNEKLKAVEQLKEELEIDYVTGEIQDLLNGIDEGATRTTEIVKGLRTFARLDEGDKKHFNIQESLDSTLLLLQHKTSDIQIVRDYRSLPDIEGFPGKINQVFMNLLDNAIQAMPDGGTIYLSTQNLADKIEIRIKDTGTGIPDSVKDRIFEPFFTTKDVGEGTGLGLSISLGIIEQHNGTIDIQSEPNDGTEIVIQLPIHAV